VYLVSANFDCLLEPLMARWSLAGVIATQAECLAGVYTGGISGEACHGEEKLRRAVARLGQAAVSGAVAYGNRDDAPLLRAVRTAYLVRRGRPVPLLARLRRGRRILSGKLSRADLGAAHQIEPFANAGSRGPAAPAEG
jgi:phosphoserine phosphatase